MFFSFVMIIFQMVFVCVCAVILFLIVKNISTWNKNNHSPRLTVPATVVAKRTQVTQQQHANAGDPTGAHGFSTTTSTSYHVTFQVESGDRMEFAVDGMEYGMLAEGDIGKLSFQGTRYLSFERERLSD